MQERNLTQEAVKAIEFVISKGERAEVVPVKDGVRVLRVRREEVKQGKGFMLCTLKERREKPCQD